MSETAKRHEDSPLRVRVLNGRVVISIGINTLRYCAEMEAVQHDDTLNALVYPLRVIDVDEFAKDVRYALDDEGEDGSTPVTMLLDKATRAAWENGSLGCADEDYTNTREPKP